MRLNPKTEQGVGKREYYSVKRRPILRGKTLMETNKR